MFCTKCGNKIPDSSKFCPKCGNKIAGASVDTGAPVSKKAPSKNRVKNSKKKQGKTGSNSRAVLIVVIVAIVLVVLGGAFAGASIAYKKGVIDWKLMERIYGAREVEEEDSDDDFDEKEDKDKDKDKDKEKEEVVEIPEEITKEEWCDAYTQYVGDIRDDYYSYAFIDVNGDDIYELAIMGSDEATGNIILTYGENGISELQTARMGFNFIKGDNLLANSDGHMGYYYDIIYSIENGEWVGKYMGEYSEDPDTPYYENGDWKLNFYWEDASVSPQEYYDNLYAVYPPESVCSVMEGVSRSQILDMLEGYEPVLADTRTLYKYEDNEIHNYEIIVGDVSWYEASEDCQERGGYLVHINTNEEYDYLVDMIESEGYSDKIFFIGGERDYFTGAYYWSATIDSSGNYSYAYQDFLEYDSRFSNYWLDGEPSYYSEGEYEGYLDMFYSKSAGKYVWNDVPGDILSAVPSYKGKIAYICEYDN